MPFAGSSLFPIKATNAEILPHDQCVFRPYAIILSPTHPTTSRSLYSPCSTVAEAHACSRPSFVDGNESVSRKKYQLVRQTARHRFSKHSPDFCFLASKVSDVGSIPIARSISLDDSVAFMRLSRLKTPLARNGRFWTPDGRRRHQLDAGISGNATSMIGLCQEGKSSPDALRRSA